MALARADIPEKARVPCHIYIDEFHNFLSDTFIEVFAEGRKYRIYLTVATQVVGLGMSPDVKKAILGNANVKILGRAGYQSREQMKKEMDYVDNLFMRKKGIWKRSFSKLKTGHFIRQYGISNPRKMRVPKFLLGNKHSMSKKKREKILAKLKKASYVAPFYKQTITQNHSPTNSLISSENNELLSKGKAIQEQRTKRYFRANMR